MKNRLVKLLILFSVSAVFVVSVKAQEKCVLSVAPRLLNLNLGDSPAQVQSAFGRDLKIKVNKKGDRTFFQNYFEKAAPNSLSGIRALYLRFLDNKLYQIEIFYEDQRNWQTLESFTADFAAQKNFAENNWQISQNKALIECEDFTLIADKILNPRIELTDKINFSKAQAMREKK